ncbi:MAG: carboxymuconolactone decarboxylase family protein [Candidatus Binataceae bacterium]
MLGRSVGLTDSEISAMADADTSALFDEKDRLVLRYARVLTRDNRVDDALYAELAGCFPREELVELCFTIGLAALVNRVHATFHTDLDETTGESVGKYQFCPVGR